MKTLSKEQVLRLHNALLETFGGTAGVRDDGLLESALNAPFATFGGQYLYPSIQAKAAQLGFGLVCNHPFVDGNKRIGAHVMLVFLAITIEKFCSSGGASCSRYNIRACSRAVSDFSQKGSLLFECDGVVF